MPLIENYSAQSRLRVLLQGPPGSGKTTTACQFPKPWVIDADMNLAGALRWLRNAKLPLPVGYDTIDKDDAGVVVPPLQRTKRLLDACAAAMNNPDVETIVLDGGTKIGDYFKDEVLKQNPTKSGGFEMPTWGFYYKIWVSFINQLSVCNKHIVFIFHEKVDKDELDGSTKFFLNIQGSFKDMAGALFTDVWRAEVSQPLSANAQPEYVIRTAQSYRNHGLKNGLGLPATFKFDWKTIEAKLNS